MTSTTICERKKGSSFYQSNNHSIHFTRAHIMMAGGDNTSPGVSPSLSSSLYTHDQPTAEEERGISMILQALTEDEMSRMPDDHMPLRHWRAEKVRFTRSTCLSTTMKHPTSTPPPPRGVMHVYRPIPTPLVRWALVHLVSHVVSVVVIRRSIG